MGCARAQDRLAASAMRTAWRCFRERQYLIELPLQPDSQRLVLHIGNWPIVPHPRHHRVEYAFRGSRCRHITLIAGATEGL
jgi:hypothetical protein